MGLTQTVPTAQSMYNAARDRGATPESAYETVAPRFGLHASYDTSAAAEWEAEYQARHEEAAKVREIEPEAPESDELPDLDELRAAWQEDAPLAAAGDTQAAERNREREATMRGHVEREARERQDQETKAAAEAEQREAAMREAGKLERQLAAAATVFDTAASELAKAATAYAELHSRHRDLLVAGGAVPYGTGRVPVGGLNAAIRHALIEAGAPALLHPEAAMGVPARPLAAHTL